MKEEMISIIVPVYNAKKYLNKCLDSIINQTYKNLDIILINDGSTDGSGRICDEYARIDNRIRVIHNINQGVSAARNKGIGLSNGKYILFIDSDDDVSRFYVERLVANISAEIDIVICGIEDIYENVKIPKNIKWRQINNDLFGKIEEDFHIIINYTRVIAAKLYKTEILKIYNINFPVDISFGEDQIFNTLYFKKIKNYRFIHDKLYKYYHRKTNSLSNLKTSTNFYDSIKMLKSMRRFLEERQIAKKEVVFLNEVINIMIAFNMGLEDNNDIFRIKEKIEQLTKIVDKKYYKLCTLKEVSLKRYLILKLMKYNMFCLLSLIFFISRYKK